jgi:hypothetical protein
MKTKQRTRYWIPIEFITILFLVSLACGNSATPTQKIILTSTDTTTLFTPSPPINTLIPSPQPTNTELAISEIGLLPGLQPEDVKLNLENINFSCALIYSPISTDPTYKWECKRETTDFLVLVEIWSKSLLTVDFIRSGVLQYGNPDDALAIYFLGYMATMPYDGAEPQNAKTWISDTLPSITESGDIRSATFGGIGFSLYGIPTARFLDIGEDVPWP